MNRKQQIRYIYAVYTIILTLAIVFALVGGNGDWKNSWRDILLSLSTELLGVTLVFIIVNRLFLVDDWSISERVDRLLLKLEASRPSAIDFFQKWPDLSILLRSAKKIDLCGVTMTSTLNKQFGTLHERLQGGADIRILVIDPESLAPKMSAERSTSPDDISYYLTRLEATLNEVKYLFKRWEDLKKMNEPPDKLGSISVRLLSYAPSFGIINVNRNYENPLLLVEIYPHKFGYKSPVTFELNPIKDGEWYVYFSDQFDQMWSNAKSWEPKNIDTILPV